jgi:hypothetical protein
MLRDGGRTIEIRLGDLTAGLPSGGTTYRLAGRDVIMDGALPELGRFAVGSRKARSEHTQVPSTRPEGARLVYGGRGWIDGHWRMVTCSESPAGYWVSVEDVGDSWVAADGSALAHLGVGLSASREVIIQTLFGPPLILALALQGTWCLHASAVAFRGRAIVFVGESGGGKSTLAEYLRCLHAEWGPLADDILPVADGPWGVDALPHFPQQKCPPDAQPSVGAPERLPVAAIYRLVEADQGCAAIRPRPLRGSEATLALARHSVAARLFDRHLLAGHLSFCARASGSIPVRDLAYLHEGSWLPRLAGVLEADIEDQ